MAKWAWWDRDWRVVNNSFGLAKQIDPWLPSENQAGQIPSNVCCLAAGILGVGGNQGVNVIDVCLTPAPYFCAAPTYSAGSESSSSLWEGEKSLRCLELVRDLGSPCLLNGFSARLCFQSPLHPTSRGTLYLWSIVFCKLSHFLIFNQRWYGIQLS